MMTLHHRKPKSLGGTRERRNIALVPEHKHKAFNLLFTGNPTPWKIATVINETWIDPDYEVVVQRRT
jgi:hypothetical protein